MDEEIINRKVDRRRLLGKAGAVAATVAGAGAVSAAVASPASASPGDPVNQGADNDAGTTQTGLRNSSPENPTLVLHNTGLAVPDSDGYIPAGPSLQLQPAGDYAIGPVGSIGVSTDGTLWSRQQGIGSNGQPVTFSDFVRTGANSTIVQAFAPVRMLDTRPAQAAGKQGIMNPSVIDGSGFVGAGQTLFLNLDSLLVWGLAVFANITVISAGQEGYITVWPAGPPQPNASNVNYTPFQVVANSAFVGVGTKDLAQNVIAIFVGQRAGLIMDISGAVVNYPSDVKIAGGAGAGLMAAAQPTRVRPAHLEPGFPA